MKKKDKYKLINYAIKEYSGIFKCNYKREILSQKYFKNLLKQYKHSCMCEWSYCCYGLYRNCWQEPYFEGNWGMSQKTIDKIILHTIESVIKNCKRDGRIAYCQEDDCVQVVIIARDLPEHAADYLITFTNKEM